MDFLEKDLEEIIYLSDKEKLSDRGLCMYGKLKRQLKIGNYGIADLIEIQRPYYHTGFKRLVKGNINIIELKKDKIGVSTFFQALNYLKGIRTYLDGRGVEYHYNYTITLIGRDVDNTSSFCYLGDLFDFTEYDDFLDEEIKTNIKLFRYKYGIEGLEFEEVTNYNLTNKGF